MQDEGSCAVFGAVAYQFTYEMARHMNWNLKSMYDDEEELNRHIFSPAFIYNLCHGYDAERNYHGGTDVWTIYALLSTYGAALESDFPSFYHDPNQKNPQLIADKWCQDTDVLLKALQYRLSSYTNEYIADESEATPIDDGPHSAALNSIKARLQNGQVLSAGAYMSCGYARVKDSNESAIVLSYERENIDVSGHRLTIVGYDDTIECDINGNQTIEENEVGALKVANSWSTDWQNGGFVWVMYDALNKESAGKGKGAFSYDKQKEYAKGNDGIDGEIERLEFFYDYRFSSIEVDTYDPVMVAEVSFPMSDSYNSAYTVGLSTNTEYPNLRDLKKSIPDIDRATFYIDCTPMMGESPYYAENYNWRLRYKNANDDTIGEPVQYKLKYYSDTVPTYNAKDALARTEFASTDATKYVSLSLALQFTEEGDHPYTIDRDKKFITVPLNTSASEFRQNFIGGSLWYGFNGLDSVATGSHIRQAFLDRTYDTYYMVLYGDVNGDAVVNQADVDRLQQYVNGTVSLTGPYQEAGHIACYYYGSDTEEITQWDVDLLSQYVNEYDDISPGYYTLQNGSGQLYLSATSFEGGQPVKLNTASGNNKQIFGIETTENPGCYRIRAAYKPSFCLTHNVNTNNVSLSYQADTDKQIWNIAYDEKGILLVPASNPQKALAISSGSAQAGAKALLVNRSSANDTKYWTVTETVPQRTLDDGVYTVTNIMGDFYWGADGGRTSDGTDVEIWENRHGNEQKWILQYKNGLYSIHPVHRPSLCLAVSVSGEESRIVLQRYTGYVTQRWFVIEGKNGDYRFAPLSSPEKVVTAKQLNRFSKLVLDADNLAGDASNRTKWDIVDTLPNPTVEEGYYNFQNVNSGWYMDVKNHTPGMLAPVIQSPGNSSISTTWHLQLSSDGYYTLNCLEDENYVMCADGDNVLLMRRDERDDRQKWLLVSDGDGIYRLSPKLYPGKVASVWYGPEANNSQLIVWDDNDLLYSRWQINAPYADGNYTFSWQDDSMPESRRLTSGYIFSEGTRVYSAMLYNGKYTNYSSWKVEYQGDGYYTIKNNGYMGDSYDHYLSYSGGSAVYCSTSHDPENDDTILWIITSTGLLIPKTNPSCALSVAGRSSSDTLVTVSPLHSSDVIYWDF